MDIIDQDFCLATQHGPATASCAQTSIIYTLQTSVAIGSNSINFLEITIYKSNGLAFYIYRKSTATDHIIPHESNNPPEHKLSAISYLSHGLVSYPLHDIDKQQEYEMIKYILYNNNYNPHTLDRSINMITTKLQTQQAATTLLQTHHEEHTTQQREKTIWSTFTYIGPETKFITKSFKHTNIKIAYKTNNTIRNLLSHQTRQQSTPINTNYNKSGIYR